MRFKNTEKAYNKQRLLVKESGSAMKKESPPVKGGFLNTDYLRVIITYGSTFEE